MLHQTGMVSGLCVFLFTSFAFAEDEDFIFSAQTVKIEKHLSFLDKTSKEWATDEGGYITTAVAAIAAFYGVDPRYITAAARANDEYQKSIKQNGSVTITEISSPEGYTICWAYPVNPNLVYHGIESTGDSTFNATIQRPMEGGGVLSLYAVVPEKTTTTRVMGTFNLAFIRNDLWLRSVYTQECQENDAHPWLSRNNHTTLSAPPLGAASSDLARRPIVPPSKPRIVPPIVSPSTSPCGCP